MEWIKCSEKVPPKREWIRLKRFNDHNTEARRIGWFGIGIWEYRSGVKENFIRPEDQWLPLPEKMNEYGLKGLI
jgi:hypothetical protein